MKQKANKIGSFFGIAFTAFLLFTSAFALTRNASSETAPNACLRADGAVSGQVLDASGRGVASANVTFEDEHGRSIRVRSDKHGCFIAGGIAAGTVYHLDVVHGSGIWAASVVSFEIGDEIVLKAVGRK